MLVGYVSGKYRDPRGPWYIVENIRAAELVAMELWKMGIAAICPHKNTALFEGPLDDPIIIAGDVELVKRSDIVVMVPNWPTSIGSKIEMKAGFDNNKDIFFWPDDIELIKTYAERFGKPDVYSDTFGLEMNARRLEHEMLIKSFDLPEMRK